MIDSERDLELILVFLLGILCGIVLLGIIVILIL